MGDVVLHAGMAKAGSTTLQHWLGDHLDVLRARGVVVLVVDVDRRHAEKPLVLRRADENSVNSGILFARYRILDRDRSVLDEFFAALSHRAAEHGTVVVSSESLTDLLCEPDLVFLDLLERLAGSHRVVVPYYVRPQHTAFEALWRHFGFREDVEPTEYLRRCTAQLDARRTADNMREHAPAVELVVRPFRRDLLDGSNVATDFASRFLDAADLGSRDEDRWENRGLPLELANALRFSPNGYFWPRPGYVFSKRNDAFQRLQRLYREVDLDADERVRRSRLVLQAYCHDRFEPGNAALAAHYGWSTPWFVPPVGDGLEPSWSIEELDALWRPMASSNELAILFHALKAAIDA